MDGHPLRRHAGLSGDSDAVEDHAKARERALCAATGHFGRALLMMRSRDPQAMGDGFALLHDMAHEHGLRLLDTGESRRLLWQHRSNRD